MSDANSQDLSRAMTVISANIKGLTASKASMISEMCKSEHCLCLQETHRTPDLARPKITGMTLVAERPTSNIVALLSSEVTCRGKAYLYGRRITLN